MAQSGHAWQTVAPFYNWDLVTWEVRNYGGCRAPDGSGEGNWYRWLDSPPHSNRVSNNWCTNLSAYQVHDFAAGVTVWRHISDYRYNEFVYRGRGVSGSFYNHDGEGRY
jgi:hypothetical protein